MQPPFSNPESTSAAEPVMDRSVLAIASRVQGILALCAWIIPLCGIPVSVAGLVLGIVGLRMSRRGLAIASIVLAALDSAGCRRERGAGGNPGADGGPVLGAAIARDAASDRIRSDGPSRQATSCGSRLSRPCGCRLTRLTVGGP